jgi:hypothetical protein
MRCSGATLPLPSLSRSATTHDPPSTPPPLPPLLVIPRQPPPPSHPRRPLLSSTSAVSSSLIFGLCLSQGSKEAALPSRDQQGLEAVGGLVLGARSGREAVVQLDHRVAPRNGCPEAHQAVDAKHAVSECRISLIVFLATGYVPRIDLVVSGRFQIE